MADLHEPDAVISPQRNVREYHVSTASLNCCLRASSASDMYVVPRQTSKITLPNVCRRSASCPGARAAPLLPDSSRGPSLNLVHLTTFSSRPDGGRPQPRPREDKSHHTRYPFASRIRLSFARRQPISVLCRVLRGNQCLIVDVLRDCRRRNIRRRLAP